MLRRYANAVQRSRVGRPGARCYTGLRVDENFKMAALYAAGGAVLSFFGFIHSPQLEIPTDFGPATVAIGYALMSVVFLVFAYVPAFQTTGEEVAEAEMGGDELPQPQLGGAVVAAAHDPATS
jgi:hypothetical protein